MTDSVRPNPTRVIQEWDDPDGALRTGEFLALVAMLTFVAFALTWLGLSRLS